MRAIIVVALLVLASCAEVGGVEDPAFSSAGVSGEWQQVPINATALGRTDVGPVSSRADVIHGPDKYAEYLRDDTSGVMLDEAGDGYLLRRVSPGQMEQVIRESFWALTTVASAGPFTEFRDRPTEVGSLHVAEFDAPDDRCVAFVQQWPDDWTVRRRIPKRLIGVICESDAAAVADDLGGYVVDSLVPELVAAVR